MMVVIAIIGVIAALAVTNMRRGRPRATFGGAGDEVQALLHAARLQALAAGHSVVVMLYPSYASGAGGTGRIIVIEDQSGTFFVDAAVPNFKDYLPSKAAFGAPTTQQPTVYDLPIGVVFGPATGRPLGALPEPLATVKVDKACTFCSTTTARGAIRFDEKGRATFYTGNGAAASVGSGASFTLSSTEVSGTRTLVVTTGTGAVLSYSDDG
jgi:type II secretory pathway pseudopilin PulG